MSAAQRTVPAYRVYMVTVDTTFRGVRELRIRSRSEERITAWAARKSIGTIIRIATTTADASDTRNYADTAA